jgi:ATP-dependent Clp protease protease subunit
MAKMNRDDSDRFHDYSLYIPTRTIYIGSESYDVEGNESGTDGLMAERAIKNLLILEHINQNPITVYLNNLGGDWQHGMAIHDQIKNAKSHVTIIANGYAMSMGGVILQAGDERVMTKHAKFMMHYGTMGLGSTHSKIFERWAKENERINHEMEAILLERIKQVHPEFTIKKLQKLLDYDTILSAAEAVTYGLADKVFVETHESN